MKKANLNALPQPLDASSLYSKSVRPASQRANRVLCMCFLASCLASSSFAKAVPLSSCVLSYIAFRVLRFYMMQFQNGPCFEGDREEKSAYRIANPCKLKLDPCEVCVHLNGCYRKQGQLCFVSGDRHSTCDSYMFRYRPG